MGAERGTGAGVVRGLHERISQRRAKRARRAELEAARRERKHVVERGEIGFTYRPTPPSGPPPKSDLDVAVGAFLVLVRERGLGRFMPDELPLLEAMAKALGAENGQSVPE